MGGRRRKEKSWAYKVRYLPSCGRAFPPPSAEKRKEVVQYNKILSALIVPPRNLVNSIGEREKYAY